MHECFKRHRRRWLRVWLCVLPILNNNGAALDWRRCTLTEPLVPWCLPDLNSKWASSINKQMNTRYKSIRSIGWFENWGSNSTNDKPPLDCPTFHRAKTEFQASRKQPWTTSELCHFKIAQVTANRKQTYIVTKTISQSRLWYVIACSYKLM